MEKQEREIKVKSGLEIRGEGLRVEGNGRKE